MFYDFQLTKAVRLGMKESIEKANDGKEDYLKATQYMFKTVSKIFIKTVSHLLSDPTIVYVMSSALSFRALLLLMCHFKVKLN